MKSTNRLRVVRAEKRITQDALAAKTRTRHTPPLPQTRISLIENGHDEPTNREKKVIVNALTKLLKRRVPIQEVFPSSEAVAS